MMNSQDMIAVDEVSYLQDGNYQYTLLLLKVFPHLG
jgi:hypothetical protein